MDTHEIQDAFKSIAQEAKGLFKDNGSRFIAHAYPVETEEEVKEIVAALKKEYYDARHHVYAYRLGYKGDKFRANDDGEPSYHRSACRPGKLPGAEDPCVFRRGRRIRRDHGKRAAGVHYGSQRI